MPKTMLGIVVLFICCSAAPAQDAASTMLPKDDGYRGIWYDMPDKASGELKYSGGLGTYPQQIRPFAIYSKEANKTFFTYGGRPKDKNTLLHLVSYYDHATGIVPRPRILLDKKTRDAHDNPCIAIDDAGYIWIFSNTHGAAERSFISRSTEPYSIDSFERVLQTSFSYGQPWHLAGEGFLFINNRYTDGRAVAFNTSRDGVQWSEPTLLAQFGGHYQISFFHGNKVGVAFNYFPRGLDSRTNLYYLETSDFGRTWQTAAGQTVQVPLKQPHNDALVVDAESQKRLVYLKDIVFDEHGRPVLLYLTTGGYQRTAANDPRAWSIARWTGESWVISDVTNSDHNYDFGQLYIEDDGCWRIIAPTETGPQPYMTGGEIAIWTSRDQGATWQRLKQLTRNSPRNHTYVRRPTNAHPDFYAFWADGNSDELSESYLYFTNKAGDVVWQLPKEMTQEHQQPEVWDGR